MGDNEDAEQPTATAAHLAEQANRSPARARSEVPKWEADVRSRLRGGVQKFIRPLQDLRERDANEGDTRLLVTDFLCEALGFDKYNDLTTEYAVRGEFADYGIRVDQQLFAFIEVKRVTTKLSERHLRQVEMYAVNEGVEWAILTNGAHWQVYHLTAGLPVSVDLAFEVDLLGEGTPTHKAKDLFYITKESLKRRQIDDLWKSVSATSPQSLTRVLLSPAVIEAMRKELRRQTGHRVETDELTAKLVDSVLRTDLIS